MKVSKSTVTALGVLGIHLKALGAMSEPPEGETHESTLAAITGHLRTLGSALESGQVALLGFEVEEAPQKKAKKAAESTEEPDHAFYTLEHDTDAAAPVLVDIEGDIVAVVFDSKGLATAITAAAKEAGVEAEDFVPFPGHRVNLKQGTEGLVCTLPDFIQKHATSIGPKLKAAYDALETRELDGLAYDPSPRTQRGTSASPAAKERSARRAQLDQKRPFSEQELRDLPKSDLMAVASLCGLDPVKLDSEAMITGILEADKNLKRNPTEEEIAEGVQSLDFEQLIALAESENISLEGHDSIESARLALKNALAAKYVPSPQEELPF